MNRRTERQDITTQTERIGVCPFVLGSASAMLIMMTMLLLIFRPLGLGLGLLSLDQIDLRVLLTGLLTGGDDDDRAHRHCAPHFRRLRG